MSSSTTYSPGGFAQRDLTSTQAAWFASAAMAVVLALDLRDGRLGIIYSVGFVLVVITVALAVTPRALFTAGVLPPLLLLGSMLLVAIANADAIVVTGIPDDAGAMGRWLAGVIDHGVTLIIGHGFAIVVIVFRILNAPAPRP